MLKRKASLLVIFLIVLVDLIGFGIVIPILPYYAQYYGASGLGIGWLMAVYSLMQFLISPVWGRTSDRIGRRPVLLISMLGTAAGLVVLGWAPSFAWLMFGRILGGCCGANISTAYAYISDITTEKDRSKGMGLIGAAFGIGFILGPAIGGILSRYGYSVPMYAAAGISLCNFVLATIVLAEPIADPGERAAHREGRPGWATVRRVLSRGQTGLPILLFFLTTLAVTQMEVVFAIFLKLRYGIGPRDAGILLAVLGLVMAIIQGGLIGRLSRRYGEVNLILAGSLICSVGLLGFGFAPTVAFTVAALIVLAIGNGVANPSLSSLTSFGADARERGVTMGVYHSASSLARVVGPPTAGFLYDSLNPRAPFVSGAVLLIAVFAVLSAKAATVARGGGSAAKT